MEKTIAIVYRMNDLFEVMVPKIAHALRKSGHDVETIVVPKGADDNQCYDILVPWHEKKREEMIKGFYILSDCTCEIFVHGVYGSSGRLDRMARDAMAAAFLRVSPSQLWDHLRGFNSLEKAKALFQKAIRAVSEKIGAPMSVKVVANNLSDHSPFRDMQNEAAKAVIQSWVSETFPQCTFSDVEVQPQTTWKIVDRHVRAEKEYAEGHDDQGTYLCFCLPVETMIQDLGELGLLPSAEVTEQMVNELVKLHLG